MAYHDGLHVSSVDTELGLKQDISAEDTLGMLLVINFLAKDVHQVQEIAFSCSRLAQVWGIFGSEFKRTLLQSTAAATAN